LNYAQQCLDLATRLDWKKGIAAAHNGIGQNYHNKGDHTRELEHFEQALKIDESTRDKNDLARENLGIGNAYGSLCNFPQALEYYNKAIKLNEETGNKKSQATTFVSIGNVYYVQSDYPRALDYYYKALKINDDINNKRGAANANFSIGNVYYGLQDYHGALEYYFKALKIHEQLGNKYGIAMSAQGIGNVYSVIGEYTKALDYDLRALKISNEIGIKYIATACVGNIGNVYIKIKRYPLALSYSRKAMEMATEIKDKHQVAWELCEIGHIYLALAEDSDKSASKISIAADRQEDILKPDNSIPAGKAERLRNAIKYLESGLDSAKLIHVPRVIQSCYEGLQKAAMLQGDYKKSLMYSNEYIVIKDSVFSNEHSEQITKIGMEYTYRQERFADSLATANAKKAEAQKLGRQRTYTWIGISGALLFAGLLFQVIKNNRLLSTEKAKSETLLLNILPSEVAEELKTTGSTVAKHFDNVTVLLTDFVNFTTAGEKMNPQELIDELHTCFKVFDEITAKYNIEKIKTIGDAYLAVAGLPKADPEHAEHIVHAAIDINNFMESRYAHLGDKTFRIRIGIHSGSVVAGIVGVKKFAYDIWGDTVNTAARMEQNSEPGRINISQTTYNLVKDKFACEYRGEVDAKNKGMLKMYYVS
jgi:adenylate cyclase